LPAFGSGAGFQALLLSMLKCVSSTWLEADLKAPSLRLDVHLINDVIKTHLVACTGASFWLTWTAPMVR
jgi:hypothetical protein